MQIAKTLRINVPKAPSEGSHFLGSRQLKVAEMEELAGTKNGQKTLVKKQTQFAAPLETNGKAEGTQEMLYILLHLVHNACCPHIRALRQLL